MRKNIHPAGLATLAFTLLLACAATTHAQEEGQRSAGQSARAGDEVAAVESSPARAGAAGKPVQAPLVKDAGGRGHEKLGAAVFRLAGLKLFVNALRSELEKNSRGARPSDADGFVRPAWPAREQGGNYIMPHPNERRSNSEPYRPHN